MQRGRPPWHLRCLFPSHSREPSLEDSIQMRSPEILLDCSQGMPACTDSFRHVRPQPSGSWSSTVLCIFMDALHYPRWPQWWSEVSTPKLSPKDTYVTGRARRAQHLRNPPKANRRSASNLLLEISPITDAPLRHHREERACARECLRPHA